MNRNQLINKEIKTMLTEKRLKIESLSTIDYIRHMDSSRDQDSTAVEYYGNIISRKQYWEYIEKYRKYFRGIGIQKGEPVTVCMVNSPEYEFVFSALLENGRLQCCYCRRWRGSC